MVTGRRDQGAGRVPHLGILGALGQLGLDRGAKPLENHDAKGAAVDLAIVEARQMRRVMRREQIREEVSSQSRCVCVHAAGWGGGVSGGI